MNGHQRQSSSKLYGVWWVLCECGWSASMSTKSDADKEHLLHIRSEQRKAAK